MGKNILKMKEGCNDDDDDNDTNIPDQAIEAPNDSDYHEPRPQHPNSTINHLVKSWIQGLHNHRHLAFCNSYT